MHPLIAKAWEDALRRRSADLEGQLWEYEALKADYFGPDALSAVAELPTVLIKARIAQGLRQKDFGTTRPVGTADTETRRPIMRPQA